jgi:hypothetical protein
MKPEAALEFVITLLSKFYKKELIVLIDDIDIPVSKAFDLFGPDGEDFKTIQTFMFKVNKMILTNKGEIARTFAFGTIPLYTFNHEYLNFSKMYD